MNFNMPYYNMMPMNRAMTMPIRGASGGIFKRLLGGFNIGSILNNTQKTLNLVNQAIPLVKQINPIVKNARTMFRVMNEFKKIDDIPVSTKENNTITTKDNSISNLSNSNNEVSNSVNNYSNQTEGPVFFIN